MFPNPVFIEKKLMFLIFDLPFFIFIFIVLFCRKQLYSILFSFTEWDFTEILILFASPQSRSRS